MKENGYRNLGGGGGGGKFYTRYVDDIFAVFENESEAQLFLHYLNTTNKMAQTFIKHTEKTRNSKTASLIAYCVC